MIASNSVAVFGVPANGTMVYLGFFPTRHMVAVSEQLGTVRPMHCSALGKAYLAALDPDALDSELGRLAYTGGTDLAAKGPLELRRRLVGAREAGFAVYLRKGSKPAGVDLRRRRPPPNTRRNRR